uniref:DNA-3-methyladenine glycosylase family protein n=1 Tax=Yoonia sp. TaxID=2212373 RepID=UPI0040482FFD|tara:strand:+ start:483 stop:1127 length:645 start_codon:yes stop_codon:yes gene_type:complete
MGAVAVTGRIIRSAEDIAQGAAWLAMAEPRFADILPRLTPLPLRRKPDGFAALMQAIMGQQVSVAAATAIWNRLVEAGLTTPDAILDVSQDDLRSLGLSRQKAKYAQSLARSGLDFNGLRSVPDDAVIKALTAVNGIGAWTAQIYAMFSLGRADVFAPGDLALQEGARMIFDLPARPDAKQAATMAIAWSPWRSVAARIIWAYYGATKKRDGIL